MEDFKMIDLGAAESQMTQEAAGREICPHSEFCGGCIHQGVP